ncbi:MAG: HAD family hydrolase [Thermoguttaceae bacterium]|nr:HAD family hydrolase [Thermoguttaceae bacterium]MDW8077597.1 HAD family hydrolase [Thermoguttaceae bacterium]
MERAIWDTAVGEKSVAPVIPPQEEAELISLIRSQTWARSFQAPEAPPQLRHLKGIRLVFFDVYGTLFLSVRTERFSEVSPAADAALAEILRSCGVKCRGNMTGISGRLAEAIRVAQQAGMAPDVDCPEINIVDVFEGLFHELAEAGEIEPACWDPTLLRRVTTLWEVVRNPVIPGPGVSDLLQSLKIHGYQLGIISNAQFYSRLLFPAFLGGKVEELGFHPALVFFSWEQGCAKPGRQIFLRALKVAEQLGIQPEEVLHVGNDWQHDIVPAHSLGLRTVLAGLDRFNVRLPEREASSDAQADIFVHSWTQLLSCLGLAGAP